MRLRMSILLSILAVFGVYIGMIIGFFHVVIFPVMTVEHPLSTLGLFMLPGLVLSLALLFFLDMKVIRPISYLKDHIKMGYSNSHAIFEKKNEIGELAQAYRQMREQIEQEHIECVQKEVALRESEDRYRRLVESHDRLLVSRWLPDTTLTFVNQAYCHFFGKTRQGLTGQKFLPLLPDHTRKTAWANIQSLVANPRVQIHEEQLQASDGTFHWFRWSYQPVLDAGGQLVEFQSFGIDITERKLAEEKLRQSKERFRELSLLDDLTGLYNTRYLYHSLAEFFKTCKVDNTPISLIFIDIDRFKHVVDNYGHLYGSQAIREVAVTVQECISEPAYGVSYGGDEYVVVLPGMTRQEGLEKAEEIRTRMSQTLYLEAQGIEVSLTASFGVANYPEDAASMKELLALADQALFYVKDHGRNAVGDARL